MLKKSKVVALLVVRVMMFAVVRPVFAGQSADETEMLPLIARASAGGILGFLLCGAVGAFAGAGLMCITDTSTGCYGEVGGGPCGPFVVR
ncbi:MAG: hypothetical protein IJP86_04005 [Synergistaceae bacterium]|nr:hypothetical protein [Synergistaceae bacterium]